MAGVVIGGGAAVQGALSQPGWLWSLSWSHAAVGGGVAARSCLAASGRPVAAPPPRGGKRTEPMAGRVWLDAWPRAVRRWGSRDLTPGLGEWRQGLL